MNIYKILLTLCIFLVGCSSTQKAVERAISETQTALPATKSPSITPSSTFTPTPAFTQTSTPTLTPTPDLRIVDGEPNDFILQKMDLPEAGGYYQPWKTSIGRLSNEEVIGLLGKEEGNAFIQDSGRIDGWFANYKKSQKKEPLPESVYCIVEKYKTAQGAELTLTEDFNSLEKYLNKYPLTKSEDLYPELGNKYVTYSRQWTENTGDKKILYLITATYHNFSISCKGSGYTWEFEAKSIAKLVSAILIRLANANLVLP